MNNPAFLIDGFTEKLILGKICQGSKINRINCNGDKVSIPIMAKKISTLIAVLNNRYYPIIILIDRENRTETIDEIKNSLKEEIIKAGINCDLRIGVCDRMIENWMMPDIENIKKYSTTDAEPPKNIEGENGKSLIRKHIPNYQETTDGVNIFLSNDPKKIFDQSHSFRDFVNQLTDIQCDWINNLFVNVF